MIDVRRTKSIDDDDNNDDDDPENVVMKSGRVADEC